MLKTTGITGVEQKNYNFSFAKAVELVTISDFPVFNRILFLLQYKLLAKIIGHTINLCNFKFRKHSDNHLNVIT